MRSVRTPRVNIVLSEEITPDPHDPYLSRERDVNRTGDK